MQVSSVLKKLHSNANFGKVTNYILTPQLSLYAHMEFNYYG